jgi:hypothetical protein
MGCLRFVTINILDIFVYRFKKKYLSMRTVGYITQHTYFVTDSETQTAQILTRNTPRKKKIEGKSCRLGNPTQGGNKRTG